MKKTIYFAIAILLPIAGCSKLNEIEKEEAEVEKPEHFITATLEGNTKTQLGGPEEGIYYPFWAAGDAVAVYVDGINQPDHYTLVDGEGTAKGRFKGTLNGVSMVGLYPYSDISEDGLAGNALHIELPAEQQYSDGSFGPGAYPMIAVGNASDMTFKNLCAVLKVSMTGEESVKSIRFVAHDENMSVSGKATVRTDFEALPELVMDQGGSPEVTLSCGGIALGGATPVDFYLVVPAGTYHGGFSVEVETFRGVVKRSTDADITFERSQLRAIPAFECVADGEIDPDDIPYNQIWYCASSKISPRTSAFEQSVVSHVFENGKGIITFDGNLTVVGTQAFYNQALTEIHLPDCVEEIGDYAFYNCKFTSFKTPESLAAVGYMPFRNCKNLSRIYGKHATADGVFILLEDGTLAAVAPAAITETVTIPENTVILAEELFHSIKTMHHVVIPEGVTTIGPNCFWNCSNLETVTLPSSLCVLSDYSFGDCPGLRQFLGACDMICDGGRCLVDNDGSLWAFAGNGVTDFVIPEGVVAPRPGAVSYLPELHSITFPSSMSNMYRYWLESCPNLEYFYGGSKYFEVSRDNHCLVYGGYLLAAVTPLCPARYDIPSDMGITQTWSVCLVDNTSIEELSFPEGVQYIATMEYMTNLSIVRFPSTLTQLGNYLFYGCGNLQELYLKSVVPPTYNENYEQEFFGRDGLVIYVPEGSEELYKSTASWSKYADYIKGYHYDDLTEPDYYISSDYSRDGTVTLRQSASEGAGINMVFMGDAFSDRQIADGTYGEVMDKMIDGFFSEEPYATYRNLFTIYTVDVVSSTEGYDHSGQALSTYFGDGTRVGGNDQKCIDYALKVIPEEKMSSTLIIVAMNRKYYAGTCYMYYPSKGDYGDGVSVAYFPLGTNDEMLISTMHHEAGGHGFAKLADEYAYQSYGEMPDEAKQQRLVNVPYGWWRNCDFTNNPTEVKWAHFLADSRYQYDGLGCYEGAFTYWTGAWRPTENSIMRNNNDGFNAPSREAIWYRIHKLAYGEDWVYNYEDFVAYDAKNRKTSASGNTRMAGDPLPPLDPPVVVPMTWQQARKKAAK